MKRHTLSVIFGAVLGTFALTAESATISTSPSLINVPAGTPQVTVSLDTLADFPATLGGVMSITWGGPSAGLLTLDHWVLGALWDPLSTDIFPGYSLNATTGVTDLYFSPNAVFSPAGPFHLIDLVFNVTGSGTANVNPTVSNVGVQEWGDSNFNVIPVSTLGASVTVAPVPLPPAVWLLLSGLTGMFAVARRSQPA